MNGESGIKRAIGSMLYGNRFTTAVRLLLGAVMVFSGAVKITDPELFGMAIARYDILPELLVPYAATVIPALEFVIGLSILIGFRARASAFIAVLIMAMFIVAISINLARGRQIECGCFHSRLLGFSFAETVSPWLVVRNMIFLTGFLIVFRAERHLLSLENFIEKVRLKNLEKTKYE
jgi:uncharacterized membrane protein YphA (DoxX/SURF4 family)